MLPVLRNNSAFAPITRGSINRWDALFDQIFGDDGGFLTQAWAGLPIAMWEDDDHIYVEVDMPGVAEQDVDVTVHNGRLFIRGERKPEEGRRYLYNGRSYGRFERVVTLPEGIKDDAVRAELKGGILGLTLPKSPDAKPRKITLQKS